MTADVVRAALLQTDWPGTKEAMIDKHEAAVHEAAKQSSALPCWSLRARLLLLRVIGTGETEQWQYCARTIHHVLGESPG